MGRAPVAILDPCPPGVVCNLDGVVNQRQVVRLAGLQDPLKRGLQPTGVLTRLIALTPAIEQLEQIAADQLVARASDHIQIRLVDPGVAEVCGQQGVGIGRCIKGPGHVPRGHIAQLKILQSAAPSTKPSKRLIMPRVPEF